jgi:hypothetical protein
LSRWLVRREVGVGILKRKPGLGDTIHFRSRDGGWEFYGVVVSGDTAAYVKGGQVEEARLSSLRLFGKVEKASQDSAPRREMRILMHHMGVVPAEEMLGDASDGEPLGE